MNSKLAQQIRQTLGSEIESLPKQVKKLFELVSKTYDEHDFTYTNTKLALDNVSQEYRLASNEFQQNVNYQELIIDNLKKAIISLDPKAEFPRNQTSYEEELNYLSGFLIDLIEARMRAEKGLAERSHQLEIANTELSNEKQKLQAANAKDSAVLLAIANGLVVTDNNQNIVLINQAFENMTGWKQSEVINKPISQFLKTENETGDDTQIKTKIYEDVLKTGRKVDNNPEETIYYKTKEGKRFPVAISVAPIIMSKQIVGVVEVFKDITIEKAIDKAKGEFVSLASHQLRTPLSIINWHSELLLEDPNIVSQQRDSIQEVYSASERMSNLVNSLLNISRIELNSFSIEPVMLDAAKEIEVILEDFQTQIKAKELNVLTNFESDIKVNIDNKIFSIIFRSLISNAVDYTTEGGEIKIAVSKTENNMKITVEDNGYGIPEKDQPHIFTKLFRGSNILKHVTYGNGLDLYITRLLLNIIGGKIEFESEENKGTRFKVTLPIDGVEKRESDASLKV